MPVPEAAVDEDGGFVFWKKNVHGDGAGSSTLHHLTPNIGHALRRVEFLVSSFRDLCGAISRRRHFLRRFLSRDGYEGCEGKANSCRLRSLRHCAGNDWVAA